MCVFVCECVCVCACVRARVRACVRVSVYVPHPEQRHYMVSQQVSILRHVAGNSS